MQRSEILRQLNNDEFDLLVVGGGASGAGVALDAAGRGLKVALVEQNDFAEGTSSRSSKLVHGGVRYLEAAVKGFDLQQLQLVYEGLRERWRFLRNAPHLARPLALLSPVYRWWQLPYLWSGLIFYDLLSLGHRLGASGYVPASRVESQVPFLRRERLKGGVQYYDGQFNDARMVVALVHEALRCGAVCLNHCQVTALERDGDTVLAAEVEDRIGGERLKITARAVVNATGPFCDRFRALDGERQPLLETSSGVHIVLDRQKFPPPEVGLLLAETEDRRVLFVLPWEGHCLVGTTDLPAPVDENPLAREEEIDYLLRHLQRIFDPAPTRRDITAAWSGLRPLVRDPSAQESSRLLRDFLVIEERGLFTLTGGKWTSYRRMAEKLVDRVVVARKLNAGICRTRRQKISGLPRGLKSGTLPSGSAHHLGHFYGEAAAAVAALATEIEGVLHPLFPHLKAEVVFAARYEYACRPLDVLTRRLPLALLDQRAALEVLPEVVRLMAGELNWTPEQTAGELSDASSQLQDQLDRFVVKNGDD